MRNSRNSKNGYEQRILDIERSNNNHLVYIDREKEQSLSVLFGFGKKWPSPEQEEGSTKYY